MTDEADMSETRTDKALRAVELLVDAVRELRRRVANLESEVESVRRDALVAACEVEELREPLKKTNSTPGTSGRRR
jgi:hypothetical protein